MAEVINKKHVTLNVATLIIVGLFLIGQASSFSSWKTEMDDSYEMIGNDISDLKDDVSKLEEKSARQDIDMAKIEVKLGNIESLLMEIRQDLKN